MFWKKIGRKMFLYVSSKVVLICVWPDSPVIVAPFSIWKMHYYLFEDPSLLFNQIYLLWLIITTDNFFNEIFEFFLRTNYIKPLFIWGHRPWWTFKIKNGEQQNRYTTKSIFSSSNDLSNIIYKPTFSYRDSGFITIIWIYSETENSFLKTISIYFVNWNTSENISILFAGTFIKLQFLKVLLIIYTQITAIN